MRHSPQAGVIVRQLSTEVPITDHQLVRRHADQQKRSVHDLLREWIEPKIQELRSSTVRNDSP